ncbi:MAG: endonuclease III [Pseudomonadota bacterium]
MKPKAVAEVFRRLREANPHPTTELEYKSPYTLLVAVVMSAQSTDAGVNKATRALFKKADTPQKMVRLGAKGVDDAIKTINFHNNKSRNVVALSEALLRDHKGEVPEDRDALEKLPGVGRKTANVILNTIFRHPTMAVDTHVFRVANRTGLAPGATPLGVEEGLLKIIPKNYLVDAHHWLILHGRYTCLARKPLCPHCVIRDICLYPLKTKENELKK